MAIETDSYSSNDDHAPADTSRAQTRARALLQPLSTKLWKFRFEGFENLPESGPAILCPNHISFLDSVFTMIHAGRQISFVGKPFVKLRIHQIQRHHVKKDNEQSHAPNKGKRVLAICTKDLFKNPVASHTHLLILKL
jgi:hypothetical protein